MKNCIIKSLSIFLALLLLNACSVSDITDMLSDESAEEEIVIREIPDGSFDPEEMEEVIKLFKAEGVDWPIWVMPTGAREEEQIAGAGKVAEKAFKRGYNVAARVHVYLFGNAIGT